MIRTSKVKYPLRRSMFVVNTSHITVGS